MPELALDTATDCLPAPAWVLLDTTVRIGRCANATTARTLTSAGSPIEVSFEVADPPRLSRCSVYSPDLTAASGHHCHPPRVTGADGAFVLLHVNFPTRDDARRPAFADFFVYRAGGGGPAGAPPPSLHLLPHPYPVDLLASHVVGVLSRGEDHCLVAVPERRLELRDDATVRYGSDLRLFSTETGAWSTKAARDMGFFDWSNHTRVFAAGGGFLAWVDLRHGILLCDVLEEEPHLKMHHIRLPQLLRWNKVVADGDGDSDCDSGYDEDQFRDVTCRDDWFWLIEREYPDDELVDDDDDDVDGDLPRMRWTATVFKSRIFSGFWELCHTVDSDDLSPADACVPDLFPEVWDEREKKLTLDKVVITAQNPTLDLYNDEAFYVIAKLNATCPNGWVLAVDARNKKVEKVAPFCSESMSFGRTYMQCAFSKYLSGDTPVSMRP